ncbi:MAG: GNAT family N-acetyltransferase [Kibdelosporangium sp.]
MSELTVRTVTRDELPAFIEVFQAAFLNDVQEGDVDWFGNEFVPANRFQGVYDDEELIGTAGILTRNMTVPGTGAVPFGGVTSVAVRPGHRRRGALTMMMREQLHGMHEESREAFAGLWASEGSIYGRFGYGMAAQAARVNVPKGTPFRPGVDLGETRVADLPRAKAMPLIKELYARVSAQRVGWLDRSEDSWNMWLWDTPNRRGGSSALRFAVHPEGYVIFRTKRKWGDRGPEAELSVNEIVADTPVASAALWRYLLDYDHVAEVEAQVAPDNPVTLMLADPRQAQRRYIDSLWIRIVDVDRALPLRAYSAPVDTVFELTDQFCPWNQGRWRLKAGEDGVATVRRATQDPDLVLDVTDLGAAFLGGTRLTELAAAGRVRELTPGSLVAASRAFTGDHAPHCPEVF